MGSPARPAGVPLVSLLSLLLVAEFAPLDAQPPAVKTLGAPTARLEEPFSVVRGVRELSDGRLIVVDSKDMTITLVDLRSGATRGLSRNGQGPGEYTLPLIVHALAADTTFVLDMLGRGRGVMIVGDSVVPEMPGYPGATLDDPAIGFNGDAVDQRGFVYSDVRPRAQNLPGVTTDRLPIERLDRRSGRREFIAHFDMRLKSPIRTPPPAAPSGGAPQRPRPMALPPFWSREQWAVSADGRIAIVSPEPYRVTFVAPSGTRLEGPVIPFQAVKVTNAEKVWHREEGSRPVPTIFYGAGGVRRAGSSSPSYEEPSAWPDALPAFLDDAVGFATDGTLWVKRAVAASVPDTYDVIDRSGRVTHQVRLPARAQLVGFGNGSLYLVRLDDDDLQYLERHPLPR